MTRLRRWLDQPRPVPRWELYCYAAVFWTGAVGLANDLLNRIA